MKNAFYPDMDKNVEQININGLVGRCLSIQSTHDSQTNIVFVLGMHSSLERVYPIAKYLSHFGNVLVPDLPGVGGMSSLYSVGKPFTLDSYADYLHTFLKSKKLQDKSIIVGMSFGFLITTRMLQKYPKSQDLFSKVVSFVGFTRAEDFKNLSKMRLHLGPFLWIFSRMIPSTILKHTLYSSIGIKLMVAVLNLYKPKYKNVAKEDKEISRRMEYLLWKTNDTRTRFALYKLFFSFNLTLHRPKIGVSLFSIRADYDQYFDNDQVLSGFRKIYSQVNETKVKLKLHAPSVIDDEHEIESMFSDVFNEILQK